MYMEKKVQFKLTLGIYRRVKHVKSAGIHVFATVECHTETFEIEWGGLPPNCSEIPYRLLSSAQTEAEAKAVEFQAVGESEWCERGVLYEESEWDNEPLWRSAAVFECYKYWHDAFRSVHFLKLEWQDWRKGESA